MNTVHDRVVRHSLASLSMQYKMIRGAHYCVKIWLKLTNPLRKWQFPKSSITRIGSPL